MGNLNLLDTNQIINGIAVLLSFFVGYRYAIRRHDIIEEPQKKPAQAETAQASGDAVDKKIYSSLSHDYKMILVVRSDLKMGKGKIGAQCGHGAVGAYQKSMQKQPHLVRAWEHSGCAKIALRAKSEHELLQIKRAADSKGLVTCLIRDAGRTQIEPDSKTVLAIGPARVTDIDQITGHLKLL